MTYKPHRNGYGKRALFAGCLGLVTFAAAACGSGQSSPGSAAATSSQTSSSDVSAASAQLAQYSKAVSSYAAQQPVAGVSGLKGKTVWYIPIGESVAILAAFGTAMQTALSQMGITVHTCDGQLLPTDAAACVSQAIAQGADGVVTGYIDYASMPTSFNSLVSHHIPVLVAGESPDGGKTGSSPQLAFYNPQSSADLVQVLDMDAVIADSKGKANILYVGATDTPSIADATNSGKAYLTSHCPGCTLTEITYDTASISKVSSQVSAALIAHPDTTYVVDELDAAVQYSVEGIDSAGYENKVKLASTDGDLNCLQLISSGGAQFVDIGISPTYTGWLYADGIIQMLLGHVPSLSGQVVRVFDKSNVAGLSLTPAAYATNAWYGSDAFEQTFLTAWGVK